MKIYTGSGDRGKTSLFSGERVAKDHERIEAYGDLDELNSVIGALAASLPHPAEGVRPELEAAQAVLFEIGAWLATSPGSAAAGLLPPVDPQAAAALERSIDRMDAALPSLGGFILPGGSPAGSWAHLARTVCRRVERRVVRLAAAQAATPGDESMQRSIVYLNRLSDYLFVLARHLNRIQGSAERLWKR
ncbi:MAG: cob(I)yrinic acid a,c-diamide adenosyltransferase [Desulfobacterales bacterium]|jgi:cob(I)alamin adenosyltransferase|nr:cob(I)yrinic acid a,c-diamide adenosyltransferase [Desulfobacterales bacterium]